MAKISFDKLKGVGKYAGLIGLGLSVVGSVLSNKAQQQTLNKTVEEKVAKAVEALTNK